jgi:hypothetical protein
MAQSTLHKNRGGGGGTGASTPTSTCASMDLHQQLLFHHQSLVGGGGGGGGGFHHHQHGRHWHTPDGHPMSLLQHSRDDAASVSSVHSGTPSVDHHQSHYVLEDHLLLDHPDMRPRTQSTGSHVDKGKKMTRCGNKYRYIRDHFKKLVRSIRTAESRNRRRELIS